MSDIIKSKEELINEINMLKIQNANLKQELTFYKESSNIKEKYKIDLARIEEILEAMPSAVVIIDAEEKFSYLNKRAVDLYGINYLGFDLDSHFANVKALKFDGTPYPLDEMPIIYSLKYGQEVRNKNMIIEKPDGKQIPVLLSTSPLFDENGTVTSAIAIFEDVTNLRRIEKSFRDSEEMMKTILENSHDGISMLDLKTEKYVFMSQSQVELTGFNAEKISNISANEVSERVHPDDLDLYIKQYKLIAAGIETFEDIEYRWKVKNGEYRWFGDRRKLVRDENGQPVALVGISRDITDRKEYEQKLALQAKILSNVKDAIIVTDENEKIIYCNKAFVQMFGWQEQELIGHFLDFAKGCVDEKSKEKIIWESEERQNAYSTVDEFKPDEIKCYSKDGTQIIIDVNKTVFRNCEGELIKS